MKNITLIILFCIIAKIQAQNDTLYFNANWEKTTKAKAAFFRPIPLKKVGNLYQVKDYYINGNLQMEAYYTTISGKILQGKAKWYYKNGQLNIIKHYSKGILEGEALYYSKKGFLRAKGIYKDNEYWSGTFLDNCCYVGYILEYKEGKKIGKLRYHSDSNQIAVKLIIENDSTTIINHLNRKGEQTGSVTLINSYPINGVLATYHTNDEDDITNLEQYFTYQNRKMNGEEAVFTKDGKLLSKGVNKDDKPISGTFFRYKIMKTYANGKANGEEIGYSSKMIPVAKGINKDDKPWQGQFTVLYTNKILNYSNGKLDGKQTTYFSDAYEKVESYYTMTNDRKDGESAIYTKDGKVIAKGVYKNNSEWDGTFLNRNGSSLSSYKKGKKHGAFIFYDGNGKEIGRQEYKEGELNGTVTSSGFFKNKSCECEYKNGEPFTGKVCKDYSVLLYDKGYVIKNTAYQYDDPTKLKSINYYEDGKLIKQSKFANNKEYILIFKNDSRYSGEDYSEYTGSITSFKDGLEHGLYYRKDTYLGITISGNKKEGNLDGKVVFENLNIGKTTTCHYKNGLPIDGIAIIEDKITSYKNGIKHGLETSLSANGGYNKPFDSISANYKKGKLDGQIEFYLENELLAKGVYKNSKPNSGIFYEDSDGTSYSIYKYNNGMLQKEEYVSKDLRHEKLYSKGKINSEVFYGEEQLIAKGTYANNLPYKGSFAQIEVVEEHYYPERFTLTTYVNGKKNGAEKVYNFKNKVFERINNFKDGILQSKINYMTFKHNDSLLGIYKNGKPYSGYFVNENHKTSETAFDVLSHYEDGQKVNYQYYATKNSRLTTLLDSIKYVENKPYKGNMLEENEGVTSKHIFENGKKIKTEIYTFDLQSPPNHTLTYKTDGFIAYRRYNNEDVKNCQVIYTNASKNEGRAIYYFNDEEIGMFSFSERGMSEAKFSYTEKDAKVEIDSDTLNIANIKIETGTELMSYKGQINTPFKVAPIDFTNWQRIFFDTDGVAIFYLDDKKTPISTCVYKQGEEYDGVTTRINKDGTYSYKLYNDGKRVESKKDLTEKQLLELLKQ